MSKSFEKYQLEVEERFYAQGVEDLGNLDISWRVARRGIAPEYQPQTYS